MTKLVTGGQIKSFVKKASTEKITAWLGEIYRNGYRQGHYDSALASQREFNHTIEQLSGRVEIDLEAVIRDLKEEQNDVESSNETAQDKVVGGEGTGD